MRTVFYSAGAWVCWSEGRFGWSVAGVIRKGLKGLGASQTSKA